MKSIKFYIKKYSSSLSVVHYEEDIPGMYLRIYEVLGTRMAFLLHRVGLGLYNKNKTMTNEIYNHIYNNLHKVTDEKN